MNFVDEALYGCHDYNNNDFQFSQLIVYYHANIKIPLSCTHELFPPHPHYVCTTVIPKIDILLDQTM